MEIPSSKRKSNILAEALRLMFASWLRVLEQFLLLMLIVGRWLLPKGALSHDQLSQLLLVYVGTAADIVEFFEAFNEDKVSSPTSIYSQTCIKGNFYITKHRI
jgi:hypothetical protein